MQEIRFDDIESLTAAVSDEYGDFGAEVEVTQEDIDAFAELTGDHQWIHVDVERAVRGEPVRRAHRPRLPDPFTTAESRDAPAGQGHRSHRRRQLRRRQAALSVPRTCWVAPARPRAPRERRSQGGGTLVTNEWDIRVVGAEKPSVLYGMQILYR